MIKEYKTSKDMFSDVDEMIHKSKSLKSEIRDRFINHLFLFIQKEGIEGEQHEYIDLDKISE